MIREEFPLFSRRNHLRPLCDGFLLFLSILRTRSWSRMRESRELRRNKAGNLKIAPLSPRVDLHFCLIVWARSHDKQKHSVLMIYVSKQGSYDPKPKIPDDSDWDSALIISNCKSVSTLHARFWKIFNFGSFQISLRSLLLAYLSAKFGSNNREFSNILSHAIKFHTGVSRKARKSSKV